MAGSAAGLKRIAKRAISGGVRGADLLRAGSTRLAGRCPSGTCVALYYHGVAACEKDRFARQMEELSRLARPLRADYEGPLQQGAHHAMVTFDDGFRSVVENALPALRALRIPATLFVPTGFLGRRAAWGRYARGGGAEENVLSEDELRALRDDPVLDIGAHSVRHVSLETLDDGQARRELVESKLALEAILGRAVRLFSFPHGAYGERHLVWAREAGYRRVFSIRPALAGCAPEDFVLGRVPAEPSDPIAEFRLKLMGAYRWMA